MIINKRIPFWYLFSLIRSELFFVVLIAGSISYLDQFFEPVLGLQFPLMPMTIPSILGTLITLVLAFKMSQSYDRWWEARKIWGAIVNDSRAFIREITFLLKEDDLERKALRDELIIDLLAWCYALIYELRDIEEISDNPYLTKERRGELDKIDTNTPNALLYVMMKKIKQAFEKGYINEFQQIRLTETINELGVSMGQCERIKFTVFPKLYTGTIDLSIWAFVVILPLAFRDPNEYIEFPIVLSISLVFFMLVNLAKDLQDPFENRPTDISMSTIARNIEIFGLKAMGEKDIPEKLPAEKFYQM